MCDRRVAAKKEKALKSAFEAAFSVPSAFHGFSVLRRGRTPKTDGKTLGRQAGAVTVSRTQLKNVAAPIAATQCFGISGRRTLRVRRPTVNWISAVITAIKPVIDPFRHISCHIHYPVGAGS